MVSLSLCVLLIYGNLLKYSVVMYIYTLKVLFYFIFVDRK